MNKYIMLCLKIIRFAVLSIFIMIVTFISALLIESVGTVMLRRDMGWSVWYYDSGFTDRLIADDSDGDTIPRSIDTVDLVRAYFVAHKSGERDKILSTDYLDDYKSRSEISGREQLAGFLKTFQNASEGTGDCKIISGTDSAHVLAYDSGLKRLAYFRYYFCGKGGIVRTMDDKYYYNKTVPGFIRSVYAGEKK